LLGPERHYAMLYAVPGCESSCDRGRPNTCGLRVARAFSPSTPELSNGKWLFVVFVSLIKLNFNYNAMTIIRD
jgi:hypothetical protein